MPQAALQVRRETRLPTQYRSFAPVPDSYNADAHTVDLVASSGVQVTRWGWDGPFLEELEISDGAIDLSRVALGQVPLLDAHSTDSIDDQLGIVIAATIDAPNLLLSVRFAASPRGAEVEARVAAGDLRGVSIGYAATEMTWVGELNGIPVFRATAWILFEASFVPVPADPFAGVRSAAQQHSCTIIQREVGRMPPEIENTLDPAAQARAVAAAATATEAARAAAADEAARTAAPASFRGSEAIDFLEQGRTFGVEVRARELVTQNEAGTISVEAARSALLTAAAEHQRARAPNPAGGVTAEITLDARDKMRSAVTSALLHRFSPANALDTKIGAADFRGMSLLEIGRRNLEANGERINGKSKREIADMCLRANSTSDFPNILANVANKTLRDGYATAAQTFKAWCRATTAADFKPVSRTQLGGAPSLLSVPEGGEILRGTIGDGKEVYSLGTYGRIFAITRQTLVNDDLDAFTRLPMMFGRSAADLESDTVYGILLANPNMGDGNPLFGTAHGNLATSGAPVAIASVQAMEIQMGSQIGLEGRPINVMPKYLLGGISTRVPAVQLLKPFTATQSSNVNPYQDQFQPIIEQRLNGGASATPWFLIADYNQVDTIEYAYLEGDDGVFLDERVGFEVEGMEFKARLDFAAKAIDWRGMVKNSGVVNG